MRWFTFSVFYTYITIYVHILRYRYRYKVVIGTYYDLLRIYDFASSSRGSLSFSYSSTLFSLASFVRDIMSPFLRSFYRLLAVFQILYKRLYVSMYLSARREIEKKKKKNYTNRKEETFQRKNRFIFPIIVSDTGLRQRRDDDDQDEDTTRRIDAVFSTTTIDKTGSITFFNRKCNSN